jgi:hypothetical protein
MGLVRDTENTKGDVLTNSKNSRIALSLPPLCALFVSSSAFSGTGGETVSN